MRLRNNFEVINRFKPAPVALMAVIKDDAYGHGAVPVARAALDSGASFLSVSTLQEAAHLRDNLIQAPLMVLGERRLQELPSCLDLDLRTCINHFETAAQLDKLARASCRIAPVHLKIDTGMNRYGVRWTDAPALIQRLLCLPNIHLEGVLSHFSMSDELDKTFARLQWQRFNEVLDWMRTHGVTVKYRHMCNSGGFLDLPEAHFDMVRTGILNLGVYPSKVCRRLPGIEPVMQVKCRLAAIKDIQPGDKVGYGMRYTADTRRRIAVLPIGYGDGFPRLRNTGHVLVHGKPASIIGANAMDATMIDVTDIPETRLDDEAVILGEQGGASISVHEIARWGQTVSYDILCGWRSGLPRRITGRAS